MLNIKTENNITTTHKKVESLLIKWGNNVSDVSKMMDLHFKYASSTYKTPSKIAQCIRSIY